MIDDVLTAAVSCEFVGTVSLNWTVFLSCVVVYVAVILGLVVY